MKVSKSVLILTVLGTFSLVAWGCANGDGSSLDDIGVIRAASNSYSTGVPATPPPGLKDNANWHSADRGVARPTSVNDPDDLGVRASSQAVHDAFVQAERKGLSQFYADPGASSATLYSGGGANP